jgi:hypothetical protein
MHTKHNMQIYTQDVLSLRNKKMYRTTTREILWAKAVWFVTSCCITLLLPSWRGESHPRLFGELVGRVVLRISSWFFFPPLLSRTCRIKIIRLRSTAWCNAAADRRQNRSSISGESLITNGFFYIHSSRVMFLFYYRCKSSSHFSFLLFAIQFVCFTPTFTLISSHLYTRYDLLVFSIFLPLLLLVWAFQVPFVCLSDLKSVSIVPIPAPGSNNNTKYNKRTNEKVRNEMK